MASGFNSLSTLIIPLRISAADISSSTRSAKTVLLSNESAPASVRSQA
ncbi:MAG: hypothetical protein ACKOHM_05990 [Spartobacteria bacterium]